MLEIIEKIVDEKEKLQSREAIDRDSLHALFTYIEELVKCVASENLLTESLQDAPLG